VASFKEVNFKMFYSHFIEDILGFLMVYILPELIIASLSYWPKTNGFSIYSIIPTQFPLFLSFHSIPPIPLQSGQHFFAKNRRTDLRAEFGLKPTIVAVDLVFAVLFAFYRKLLVPDRLVPWLFVEFGCGQIK
jgi:hypothetical protein